MGDAVCIEAILVVAVATVICAGLSSNRYSWILTRHVRSGERLRRGMLVVYPALAGLAVLLTAVPSTRAWAGLWAPGIVALTMGVMVGNLALIVRGRLQPVAAAAPKRVLAIGAHPDDLELACGGTLARLVDGGHHVRAMVMSRGGVGGDSQARVEEAALGAFRMGSDRVSVHDFPDTNLALTGREMTLAIEKEIEAARPDIIMTHSSHDQHQDHQAVHQAVLRAARKHHSIICFESPSVTSEFTPTVFFDVDEYVAIKQGAVAAHQDQLAGGKAYMGNERLQGTAVFRGGQVKRRRAEGFEVVRLLADEAGVI